MRLLQQVGERAVLWLLKRQQGQGALEFAEYVRIRFACLRHLGLGEGECLLDFAGPTGDIFVFLMFIENK